MALGDGLELTWYGHGTWLLKTGEGKFDEAWQDPLTCDRLGRLIAGGPSTTNSCSAVTSAASPATRN